MANPLTIYSVSDVAFQGIRIIIWFSLVYGATLVFQAEALDESAFQSFRLQDWSSAWFGLLAGSAAYLVLYLSFNFGMLIIMKCEYLGALDRVFMFENPRNPHIIVAALVFEQFDFDSMKNYLIPQLEATHKCTSRLVKHFGMFYYQKMTPTEMAPLWDSTIVRLEGIHSNQELSDFMEKQQEENDFKDVQYRIFLIPDFQEGQSVFIFKSHHSFSDGLGISALMLKLSGEYDASALPGMKPLSLAKKLAMALICPFLILYTLISVGLAPVDSNSIKNSLERTGRRKGAFSNDFDPDAIKAYCKQRCVSINDYMSSILCLTIHEYCSQGSVTDVKGNTYPVPKMIKVGLPFSMRQPQAKMEDFRLENDYSSIPIEFKVTPDFEEALTFQQGIFNRLKNSIKPFGPIYTAHFTQNLPFRLPTFSLQMLSEKFSIIFTNVNACKKQFVLDGKACLSQFFYAPGFHSVHTVICLLTVHKKMGLSVISDETCISRPQEFVDIFVKMNQKQLGPDAEI